MKKVKLYLRALLFVVISPVLVPAVILWEERKIIKDFYAEAFEILTFQSSEFKTK